VRSYYADLIGAVADLHIEILHPYVTGEAVILEVMISGTHTGAWRGLPGTGKSIRFPLCGIFTFDQEDKLRAERIYYDRASVLRQLGVFREPTSLLGRFFIAITHPVTMAIALGRGIVRK
jgi:steroid delta-isomerase-like uncharacterized protein